MNLTQTELDSLSIDDYTPFKSNLIARRELFIEDSEDRINLPVGMGIEEYPFLFLPGDYLSVSVPNTKLPDEGRIAYIDCLSVFDSNDEAWEKTTILFEFPKTSPPIGVPFNTLGKKPKIPYNEYNHYRWVQVKHVYNVRFLIKKV